MKPSIRIFNEDREILAVLENATQLRLHLKFNEATQIQFNLPDIDEKGQLLELGAYIEVWQGEELLTTGELMNRDNHEGIYDMVALTEEKDLDEMMLPFGSFSLRGGESLFGISDDLADIMEALTYSYRVRSVNRDFGGASSVSLTDAEISFDLPDMIALAQDADYIYPVIELDDAAGRCGFSFTLARDGDGLIYIPQRIRWEQQVFETSTIAVRHRYSISGSPEPWSAWVGEYSASDYSEAVGFALTEPPAAATHLHIQFQLLNEDGGSNDEPTTATENHEHGAVGVLTHVSGQFQRYIITDVTKDWKVDVFQGALIYVDDIEGEVLSNTATAVTVEVPSNVVRPTEGSYPYEIVYTVYGSTPIIEAVQVIERIAATRREIVPHSVDWPSSSTVSVDDDDFGVESHLSIANRLCEKYGYEFYVQQGELHFAEQLGQDRSDEVVFKFGYNMNLQNLEDDTLGFCNVAHLYGEGEGLDQISAIVSNTPSVNKYGATPKVFTDTDITTVAELFTWGQEIVGTSLASPGEMGIPLRSIRFQAVTEGDNLTFNRGDTVRVIHPGKGLDETGRAMEIFREFTEGRELVRVSLNQLFDSFTRDFLRRTVAGKRRTLPPGVPSQLTTRVGFRSIALSWTGVTHAHSYRVYVARSVDSVFRILYEGPETKFLHDLLPREHVFYYKVTSLIDGKESAPSSIVSAAAGVVVGSDVDGALLEGFFDSFAGGLTTGHWSVPLGNITSFADLQPGGILTTEIHDGDYIGYLVGIGNLHPDEGEIFVGWSGRILSADSFILGYGYDTGVSPSVFPEAEMPAFFIEPGTAANTIKFTTRESGMRYFPGQTYNDFTEITDNIPHDVTSFSVYQVEVRKDRTRLIIDNVVVAVHKSKVLLSITKDFARQAPPGVGYVVSHVAEPEFDYTITADSSVFTIAAEVGRFVAFFNDYQIVGRITSNTADQLRVQSLGWVYDEPAIRPAEGGGYAAADFDLADEVLFKRSPGPLGFNIEGEHAELHLKFVGWKYLN